MFFAVDGPTGVGKSKVTEYLRNNLRGRLPGHIAERIVFLKDSEGSPLAAQVRNLARSGVHELGCPKEQMLLFWTSRLATCKHLARLIQNGRIPIVERFGASTWAHQVYFHDRERDLDELHWAMVQYCVVREGLQPPHYLMLTASPESLDERILRREKVSPFPSECSRQERIDFLARLMRGYSAYAEHPTQTATLIDANGSIQESGERAVEAIITALSMKSAPLAA